MQKDYIKVDNKNSEEIKFVEKHWTEKWQNKFIKIQNPEIKNDEEYKLLAPFLKNQPASAKILDGGCGLGKWVLALDRMGYETYGLDISNETVKFLKNAYPDINFAQGDIRHTIFTDNFFDYYLSWGTFEHFEEGPSRCIIEANRILKKDGLLFITVPYQNLRHILRGYKKLKNYDNNFTEKGYRAVMRFYQWRFTKTEIEKELEINGFKVEKIYAVHHGQGVIRLMQHELGMDTDKISKSAVYKTIYRLIYIIAPKFILAHMLLVVARKK